MDPTKVSEYNKKYYQKHREGIALRRLNKRHEGKEGFIPLTMEEWNKVKVSQKGLCKRCSEDKTLTPFVIKEPKQHIIGLCALCGSKEALALARAARQRMKDAIAEKASEQFTGAPA